MMKTDDIAAYRDDLRRFLLRLGADAALADDIAQETLLRALAHASAFEGRSRPLTWLSAIALNLFKDHFRLGAGRFERPWDDSAVAELPDGAVDAETRLQKSEMESCILAHVMALPERMRDVVLLHHMAEADHRQIAAALDISPANARVLLHRGRAALKDSLTGGCRLDFRGDAIPCSPRDDRG